jgi:hypothetical protein
MSKMEKLNKTAQKLKSAAPKLLPSPGTPSGYQAKSIILQEAKKQKAQEKACPSTTPRQTESLSGTTQTSAQ